MYTFQKLYATLELKPIENKEYFFVSELVRILKDISALLWQMESSQVIAARGVQNE